jgi:hypothetical protein
MTLRVSAAWNSDPASTAQIGYAVTAAVEFLGRRETCFPLPDLRITVNDSDFPIAVGDCDPDVGVEALSVRTDADIVVTLSSGHRGLGAATVRGLFPGIDALQLVSPADGRVRMGETLALAIPPGWPSDSDKRVGALVHWLAPAPSVPPFYSPRPANVVGRAAVEVSAPTLTGSALLIVRALVPPWPNVGAVAEACTGFSRCLAGASSETLGPVAIEVIP